MDGEFELSFEQVSDAKILIISVAARMAGLHPQTLRQYDRLGLVQPGRAPGGGRRYSARDVALLREIQRLSQEDGVNLAGIKRIIELEQLSARLQQRVRELELDLEVTRQRAAEAESMLPYPPGDRARRELMRFPREASTALVVWRPRRPQGNG